MDRSAQEIQHPKKGEGATVPPSGDRDCPCTGRGASGPLVLSTLRLFKWPLNSEQLQA